VHQRLLHDGEPEPAVLRRDREPEEPELLGARQDDLREAIGALDLLPDRVDDLLDELLDGVAELSVLVAQGEVHWVPPVDCGSHATLAVRERELVDSRPRSVRSSGGSPAILRRSACPA
jgi:hypothetical protein